MQIRSRFAHTTRFVYSNDPMPRNALTERQTERGHDHFAIRHCVAADMARTWSHWMVRFMVAFYCHRWAGDSTFKAMTITREMFTQASSHPSGHGWTNSQLKVLGSSGEKGWMSRFIGTEISDEVWERFVRAGDKRRRRNQERINDGSMTRKRQDSNKPSCGDSVAKRQTPTNETFNIIPKAEKDHFYASDDWKDIRMLALRRGGYRCNYCGATKHNSILHVDHKVPLSVDWSRRLDLLNLQVLCAECNVGKRNYHSDDGDKIEGIECPF